jgi:hypothetical protein
MLNAHYPITRASSASESNPTTATILADTGALATGGIFEARFILGASAAAIFALQRRNAANDATVGDVVLVYVAAGQSECPVLRFEIEADERIRVTMGANLTGTAAATVAAQRVG